MHVPERRSREHGFSMLIVLILLIMLVGIAMILLATSRSDVFSATNEREQAIAFYAAEAGIAHGKAYMSSLNFNEATKFTALIGQTLTKTVNYEVPNSNPVITVPASYQVTFFNNQDGSEDAGTDNDAILIIQSVGIGPNNARAVLQVASGLQDLLRTGTGYCAQANPPPSCRGQ